MLHSRFVSGILSVSLIGLAAGAVCGQDYPSKPIRLVTGTAGGGADFTARLVAQGISGALGQPVVVDNRAGGAVVFGEVVAKAPPDGYTLYVGGAALWLTALLRKVPYDVMRDFAPVTLIESVPNVVTVHPSIPVKSIKELIALAKGKPGQLNYASTGVGSNAHLATELFKSMAGVNIVDVPYKGPAPAMAALIGGEVQMIIIDAGVVAPHVKSGRLRALAVTSTTPSTLAPGLPTVSASGLPGYESVGMTVMFAPAKTPGAVIIRLNQEVVRYLNRADVKEQFLNGGVETVGSSPDRLAVYVKADMANMGKVIRDAGIKVE